MTMTNRRRSAEARVVLAANLNRVDTASALWASRDDDLAPRLGEALRLAIATELTDKQREVIEAYFFEGISQEEIARRLGVTQQVVHKRIFGAARGGKIIGGAVARLRRALEPLTTPDEVSS